MSKKMLYIVRGLPGSGKSTLAVTLAGSLHAPHYEEDTYLHDRQGNYLWTEKRMNDSIEICISECRKAMQRANQVIVVSNVFEKNEMLNPYQELADQYGYHVTYMIVENRRGGVNIHNVPDEALEQMRADFEVRL